MRAINQAVRRMYLSSAVCSVLNLFLFSTIPTASAEPARSTSADSCIAIREQSGQSTPNGGDASQGESTSRKSHHIRVPVDDEEQPLPELKDVEAAIDSKDYSRAESLLQKFSIEHPENYVAWFDLGFVENALGKTDDSIAAYRKSVAAKPDVFEANLNLGLLLAKSGQTEAENFLRAATRLTPTGDIVQGRYRAWLALGGVIEKTEPEGALAAYQEAAELEPSQPEPHLSRGAIFEQENKYADAESEYRQALKLDPHSSDAMTGLSDLYMRGRRFPEAEEFLRKLAAEQPGSAAVHIQLGRVLAAEAKTDAAIAELQIGIRLDPHDEASQRDLAQLYTTAGKNDLGEAAYRELIVAHPEDAELHRILGETLLKEKKFPEAEKEFARAVKLKPDLGEAYGGLAFAAGENKDFVLALRALDTRAKFLPEIPVTYFMRASAYDHLRDFKKAAVNYHLFLNTAEGKYPDEEWQAKHRLIAIEPKR